MGKPKSTKRSPLIPPWFRACCSVAEDTSAPDPVRARALDAAIDGVKALRLKEAKGCLTRCLQLDLGGENQRLELRLGVLQKALRTILPREAQPEWALQEHWRKLSEPALQACCFSESDAEKVINANLATDLDWVLHEWWGAGYAAFWPKARDHVDGVRLWKLPLSKALEDKGVTDMLQQEPHFDDLFTYDLIAVVYNTLQSWAIQEAKKPISNDRFCDLLGLIHHAVQDFYCHTNWIEICKRVVGGLTVPTWDEVHKGSEASRKLLTELKRSNTETIEESSSNPRNRGGLQSGAWAILTFEGKRPWKHRHPKSGTKEYDAGIEVAERATVEWTKLLQNARP